MILISDKNGSAIPVPPSCGVLSCCRRVAATPVLILAQLQRLSMLVASMLVASIRVQIGRSSTPGERGIDLRANCPAARPFRRKEF
jgi:hypothetical protein